MKHHLREAAWFMALLAPCMILPALHGGAETGEPTANRHHASLDAGGVNCVIGDNAGWEAHQPGYNGLYQLCPDGALGNVFVPSYAGWNLEHYFDGRDMPQERSIFFEPRTAPMRFNFIDAITAELYQPETPYWGVESWSRFSLGHAANSVNFAFRCVAHKPLQGGFLGCFWASYINAPPDKSLYFLREGSSLDKPVWTQFCTLAHNRDSTVLPEGLENTIQFATQGSTLFNSISPLRYSVPVFYGRVGDMVLIYLFEPGANIRFSHSPSGGGPTAVRDDTNPAWDFQFIVPNIELGREYGFRARLVCKTWADRSDVIAETRRFLADIEAGAVK